MGFDDTSIRWMALLLTEQYIMGSYITFREVAKTVTCSYFLRQQFEITTARSPTYFA